jgi:hypothetical protein
MVEPDHSPRYVLMATIAEESRGDDRLSRHLGRGGKHGLTVAPHEFRVVDADAHRPYLTASFPDYLPAGIITAKPRLGLPCGRHNLGWSDTGKNAA